MTDPNTENSGEPQTASIAAPDQWLVRTRDNRILGPLSRAEICQLIFTHRLGIEDEVCRANFYWFYLHEHKELSAQLGIHLPRQPRDDDDEVTETETAVSDVTADVTADVAPGSPVGITAGGGSGTPVGTVDVGSPVPAPHRETQPEKRDPHLDAEEEFRRQLAAGIERTSFRKTLVTLLFLLFIGLLIWMFRLLRTH